MKKKVHNWGNFPTIEAEFSQPSDYELLKNSIIASDSFIPRGMGRCYGDSALNSLIISSLRLNRFIAFDAQTGIITCESGVSFDDILRLVVPQGFFLPVTPGTKFITVGGAIASDIHGKNHHVAGTFSDHLVSFKVMDQYGNISLCSHHENSELFWLTCGGMGLTGFILEATFQLMKIPSAYIQNESIKAPNLDAIMQLFENSADCSMSVAWIDCLSKGKKLGRSLLQKGEFAPKEALSPAAQKNIYKTHSDGKLSIPFYFPSFALNSLSVKAFNFLYYHKQTKAVQNSIVHYDPFFYPLDAIHHWNRIYGKNGFTQYQFVLPKKKSREGLIEILDFISKKNEGSFLAVLKLFGAQKENFIRFPKEGYTLALDFKIHKGLWAFLDQLDNLVDKHGGRVYLTKDVRMHNDFFFRSYPEAANFKNKLNVLQSQNKISSLQSERLKITL